MKVRELLERLRECDPDAKVGMMVDVNGTGYTCAWLHKVSLGIGSPDGYRGDVVWLEDSES
jgi:hypothetical protein